RLLQVAGADQVGQLVADRRRREGDEVFGRQDLRADGDPGQGVVRDHGLENLLLTLVERGRFQHIGSLHRGVLIPILAANLTSCRRQCGSIPTTFDRFAISTRSESSGWNANTTLKSSGSPSSCIPRSRRKAGRATRCCRRCTGPGRRKALTGSPLKSGGSCG